jgi:hypothetical protein
MTPPSDKTELLLQMLFANNLIVLLVAKNIPPAKIALLEENEELINYSILLFVFM